MIRVMKKSDEKCCQSFRNAYHEVENTCDGREGWNVWLCLYNEVENTCDKEE